MNSFWITNISNKNISLSDLNLTIKAGSCVNLLDKRHYSYTESQLIDSWNKGSLSRKRNQLMFRQTPPESYKPKIQIDRSIFIPSRGASVFTIPVEQYDELNISDEQFAEESANLEIDEPLSKGK